MSETSDAPIGWRKPTPWRRLFILLGATVVLVAALYCTRPAYRRFKDWRSRRLAATAEALISRNEWPRATTKAQAAYWMNRNQPAALRALARVLTHSTNAAALTLWQQLSLAGQATEEERRAFVDLAIQTGALDLAAGEMRRLLTEAPNNPLNLWQASQLFAASGDFAQMVHYARRASLHEPANERYRFFLSSALFEATDPAQSLEARSNVWSLARQNSPIGLEALSFLGRRLDFTSEDRRELIRLLEEHPLSSFPQKLLALDQCIRLEPDRRKEILDQAVARYKGSDPETSGQFAVWLNQHGEYERALAILPLNAALDRKERFIPHLDALGGLGRWQEVATILDTEQGPLEAVYLAAFKARCALQMGNTHAATANWLQALTLAKRDPAQLAWLTLYAEKCGAYAEAKKACRLLISYAADPRAVYRTLTQLTLKSSTTEELDELIAEMLRRWPNDPSLRNDHAYLNLLLGKEVPAARDAAEELVKRNPESLSHRTTLALAWYRLKDFSAAERVYEGKVYDWRLALPGNRAVYAAVLAASGKSSEARDQARAIPREMLRQEEFELVRALVEQAD